MIMTTLFTPDHEWLRIEGDVATIGVTDYAQSQLGDVVFVELPKVGRSFKKAEAAAVVESVALDRLAHLVADARPAALGRLAHALLRQPQPTVQRRPAHDLGVNEVLGLGTPLPQPVVGLLPRLG